MDTAPEAALEKVRALCLELSEAVETVSYGHPTWKVRGKTFAVFEQYKGDWCVAILAEPARQQQLMQSDERFYPTPYIGAQGWVSFKLQGRIPWARLGTLLREAHLLAS
jgi:predicted DNA-binding protein (MmcQ/YjbR family)